ncbi:MAG: hypothetical protein WBF20_10875 [Trebonia sp.]|uniref:hypothetical protein n=1 Tax=Trebonia sp. TaxID=2767075 RepID=UPI003C71039D
MTDWATVASLATAGGTLVLAGGPGAGTPGQQCLVSAGRHFQLDQPDPREGE